jgi:hypothetical protein
MLAWRAFLRPRRGSAANIAAGAYRDSPGSFAGGGPLRRRLARRLLVYKRLLLQNKPARRGKGGRAVTTTILGLQCTLLLLIARRGLRQALRPSDGGIQRRSFQDAGKSGAAVQRADGVSGRDGGGSLEQLPGDFFRHRRRPGLLYSGGAGALPPGGGVPPDAKAPRRRTGVPPAGGAGRVFLFQAAGGPHGVVVGQLPPEGRQGECRAGQRGSPRCGWRSRGCPGARRPRSKIQSSRMGRLPPSGRGLRRGGLRRLRHNAVAPRPRPPAAGARSGTRR